MKPKDWIYYVSKFTLIDEVLGFLYWVLSLYGIYLIVENINSSPILILTLCVYIVSVVIIYITVLKKIKHYFKHNSE